MASAAPLPLFYKGLEPLSSEVHAAFRLRPQEKAPYLVGQHAIPLTVEEFPLVQRFMPIVFTLGDESIPIALMGLNEGINVFVDDEWNVTCLTSVEWICALPAEKLAAPYWLTSRSIDEPEDEHPVEFDKIREEFMAAFEQEEQKPLESHALHLSRIMREAWESGGVWFWLLSPP